MNRRFQILVKDVFLFQGGRTVFVGEGTDLPGYIPSEGATVWVDDELAGLLRLEGEMLSTGRGSATAGLRSVSTTETTCLTRESVLERRWVLKSIDRLSAAIPMTAWSGSRETMHRHLLGIESPPPEFVADPLTQGPMLPEGWDGDAWVAPEAEGYYLRAWNAHACRVAYGRGKTYSEARAELLRDLNRGKRRVDVTTVNEGA